MNTTNINSKQYNDSITVSTLMRDEVIDPKELKLMRYSRPNDTWEGFPSGNLGNQHTKDYDIILNGQFWKCTEFLYLCGKWSWEGDDAKAIQEDVRTATSGKAAKQYKDSRYRKRTRSDWNEIRVPYMLWCVWQKCVNSKKFSNLLLSVPEDCVITEVEKRDAFWALIEAADGTLHGKNIMGKILTICRRCLIEGTQPEIATDLLNKAGIYLLGEKVTF